MLFHLYLISLLFLHNVLCVEVQLGTFSDSECTQGASATVDTQTCLNSETPLGIMSTYLTCHEADTVKMESYNGNDCVAGNINRTDFIASGECHLIPYDPVIYIYFEGDCSAEVDGTTTTEDSTGDGTTNGDSTGDETTTETGTTDSGTTGDVTTGSNDDNDDNSSNKLNGFYILLVAIITSLFVCYK